MRIPTLITTVMSSVSRWVPILNTPLPEARVIMLTSLPVKLSPYLPRHHVCVVIQQIYARKILCFLGLRVRFSLCRFPFLCGLEIWFLFHGRRFLASVYLTAQNSNPPCTWITQSRVGFVGLLRFSLLIRFKAKPSGLVDNLSQAIGHRSAGVPLFLFSRLYLLRGFLQVWCSSSHQVLLPLQSFWLELLHLSLSVLCFGTLNIPPFQFGLTNLFMFQMFSIDFSNVNIIERAGYNYLHYLTHKCSLCSVAFHVRLVNQVGQDDSVPRASVLKVNIHCILVTVQIPRWRLQSLCLLFSYGIISGSPHCNAICSSFQKA